MRSKIESVPTIGSHGQPCAITRPSQDRRSVTVASTKPDGPNLAIRDQFANRNAAVIEPRGDQGTRGVDSHLRDQLTDTLTDLDRRLALRSRTGERPGHHAVGARGDEGQGLATQFIDRIFAA